LILLSSLSFLIFLAVSLFLILFSVYFLLSSAQTSPLLPFSLLSRKALPADAVFALTALVKLC
jgi:hypothetical protein